MTDSEHTHRTDRLWTPWRMPYIGGANPEKGCIFCNRLDGDDDVQSLILYRGAYTFAIMNLYPYNTGHIMLVPNAHVADPAEMSSDALRELGELLPLFTDSLRSVLGCDGFNIGLNIGEIAGAGVAQHLHQHIVPRWKGDANFMPILASTMTIPELIPVTYAKIRAEVQRNATSVSAASYVVLDPEGEHALTHNASIPSVGLVPGKPVWQCVVEGLPTGLADIVLSGWAGERQVSIHDPGPIALTLQAKRRGVLPDGWKMTPITDATLDDEARSIVQRATVLMAPEYSR